MINIVQQQIQQNSFYFMYFSKAYTDFTDFFLKIKDTKNC